MTDDSERMNDSAMNPYLDSRMPLSRVRLDALQGVKLAREAWRTRDSDGAARELGRVVERPIVADDTRERQARVLQATGDYLRRAQRPGRAGAGEPLFDKQQAGFEDLDP